MCTISCLIMRLGLAVVPETTEKFVHILKGVFISPKQNVGFITFALMYQKKGFICRSLADTLYKIRPITIKIKECIMDNSISVIIGSWGSYNECNERALGSKWLTLNDYDSWEKIEEELESEGFILDGIDEELFIQDVENVPFSTNWDYTNPEDLFNLLKESGILDDEYLYEVAEAYCEIESFEDFESLVANHGNNWSDGIAYYSGQTLEDVAYDLMNDCYTIPDYLSNYIDYEAFARDLSFDGYHECSNGVICIQ